MKQNEILRKGRTSDEYLPTVTAILTSTRWIGIPVYGGKSFVYLAVLVISMLVYIEVMAIQKLIRSVIGFTRNTDAVTTRVSGAIFYANALTSFILIWRLLRTWKRLSKFWLKVETSNLYLQPDSNIKRRVIFVTCFVMLCGCVEHGLSITSAIGFDCAPSECFGQYILASHSFMLYSYEYNLWVALPIFITNLIATIIWNIQDLVVILISMGLVSRYHRLNTYVKRFVTREKQQRGKIGSTCLTRLNTWRNLREAYVQQAKLVRKVDKELGCLTILCNLNNFFFICLQLFFIIRKIDGTVWNNTYYMFSFGWLVFRASSVLLAAADVNLYSKRALTSIYKCPRSGFNIEIKRLKYHLINDDVSLTGMGIFIMNRQTILEMAAAIVKYELILINFDT